MEIVEEEANQYQPNQRASATATSLQGSQRDEKGRKVDKAEAAE
jgi:hypothetical protein